MIALYFQNNIHNRILSFKNFQAVINATTV